jgi:hypothetical protein
VIDATHIKILIILFVKNIYKREGFLT